jgi:hypothetical protein
MTYGGFRTGNVLANGDMENRMLEAIAGAYYTTRFWTFGSGNGMTCTFRNTTYKPYDRTYCTEFNITNAVDAGPQPYAYMLQMIPLEDGLQVAQLDLLHRLTANFWMEAGLGTDVAYTIEIGARYEDGTTDYKKTVKTGTLTTGAWTSVDEYLADLWDEWTGSSAPHTLFDATDLVVRFLFETAGSSTGPARLAVDAVALTAEMEFGAYPSFPEDIERDRQGAQVRLGDTSRTLVQSFAAKGRSKQSGVLHFRLVTKTERYQLEGIWAYASQHYIVWIPAMATIYPTSISMRPRGKFKMVASSPNVSALYSGDWPWDEY